ncbi:MAG TPA: AbrB family transcriptional regulator [Actinomycetota bacterium]|nr:AbrB family transcriptional regulator [Actinomycetota bacterium]
MNLVFALLVATVGGLIGMKIGLPQGALLGGLLAAAALNVSKLSTVPKLPAPLLFAMYVLIAVELGAGVERATLGALAKVWLPAVVYVALLVVFSVGCGLAIHKIYGGELSTWVMGTAPGAVSGIAALAADVKANVAVVVALHTLRVTAIVFLIPPLYKVLAR